MQTRNEFLRFSLLGLGALATGCRPNGADEPTPVPGTTPGLTAAPDPTSGTMAFRHGNGGPSLL